MPFIAVLLSLWSLVALDPSVFRGGRWLATRSADKINGGVFITIFLWLHAWRHTPNPWILAYTSARALVNCRCGNCISLSVRIRFGDPIDRLSLSCIKPWTSDVVNHYKWPSKSFYCIYYQSEPLLYATPCYYLPTLLSWYLLLPLWPSVLRGGRWQLRLWENDQIFHPFTSTIFCPRHQWHTKTTQNARVHLGTKSECLGMHLLGFFVG